MKNQNSFIHYLQGSVVIAPCQSGILYTLPMFGNKYTEYRNVDNFFVTIQSDVRLTNEDIF